MCNSGPGFRDSTIWNQQGCKRLCSNRDIVDVFQSFVWNICKAEARSIEISKEAMLISYFILESGHV